MEIEPEYQILIRYYLENNSNSELITIIPETAMLFETTTNKHKIDITDIYLFLKFDGVNTEKIKWIKIYNKILNGFEYLTNQTQIDVEHNMEISLLVATNQKIENHYYEEVINSLENRKKSLKTILQLSSNDTNNVQNFLFDINTNSNKSNINQIMTQKKNKSSDTDIIILYANPIVFQEVTGKICAQKEGIIDYESEIEHFKTVFEESKKEIKIQIDIANLDNLTKAVKKQPTILYISCHGTFHEEGNENIFDFVLEDKQGKAYFYSIKNLQTLFNSINSSKDYLIDICFLSTCHSELAAKVFSDNIAKCVICVNSQTKIMDKAAQVFAQTFYKKLLEGKTIIESFEISKNVVTSSINQGCCCSHLHQNTCKNYSHYSHFKKCDCEFVETNAHSILCGWAKDKIQNCGYNKIEKKGKLFLCCCGSPESVHSESQKFQIVTSPKYKDFLNTIPFPNLPQGKMEIMNQNCFLNYNVYSDYKTCLLGRHLILYEIIEFFNEQINNVNRIVNLYNFEKGYHKKNFANFLGKYLFERNFFPNGVFHVTIPDKITCVEDIMHLVISTIDLSNTYENFETFCKVYSFSRILLILYFYSTDIKKLSFIYSFIEKIISLTKNLRIVFVSKNELPKLNLDFVVSNNIFLGPISDLDISSLFLNIIDNSKIPDYLQNKESLSKHPLIKNCKGIPNQVYLIKNLLEDKKENIESIVHKISSISKREDQLIDEIKKKYSDYSQKMKELFLLFILLPNGISEEEIETLFGIENLKNLKNKHLFSVSKVDRSKTIYNLKFSHLKINDFDETNLAITSTVNILIYYSYILRIITNQTRNHFQFKPWDLSALNTFSIWNKFESVSHNMTRANLKQKFQKNKKIHNSLPVSQLKLKFFYIGGNVLTLLSNHFIIDQIKNLKENINQELYNEFVYSIEEVSICIPTLLKVFHSAQETMKKVAEIYKILEILHLKNAKYRLSIFEHSLSKKVFAKPEIEEMIENMKNDYACEAEAYIAIAIINRSSKEYSLSYLNKAFDIYTFNLDKFGEMRITYLIIHLLVNSWEEYFELIKDHFENAIKLSEELNHSWFKAHLLYQQAKILYLQKDYVGSEGLITEIKGMASYIKDKNYLLEDLNTLLNKIYAKNDLESKNLFIFLIHKPLESQSDILKRSKSFDYSDPLTNIEKCLSERVYFYKSFIQDMIKEAFSSFDKKIIIKFNSLNLYNFAYALRGSGKVLYISSEFYVDRNYSLFIDREEQINLNSILNELGIKHLRYEIIIFAFPNSEKFMKILDDIDIKYNYIITFDIPKEVTNNSYIFINDTVMNLIENFMCDFLTDYIEEQTQIISVFNEYYLLFIDNYRDLLSKMNTLLSKNFSLTNQSRIAFLHYNKINPPEPKIKLNEPGNVEDISNFKCRDRFASAKKPLIHNKIYKKIIFHSVLDNIIVNICCPKEIGYKVIKDELLNFINETIYFNLGMFSFDLSGVKSLNQLKEVLDSNDNFQKMLNTIAQSQKDAIDLIRSMSSYSNSTLSMAKINSKSSATVIDSYKKYDKYENNVKNKSLVVFYNLEKKLIKENELVSFFNTTNYLPNSHIVFFSSKEIEGCDSIITLPPLDDLSSSILFIYYLERLTKLEEFQNKENKNNLSLLESIKNSKIIKLCKGYNKTIKKYALLSNSKPSDLVVSLFIEDKQNKENKKKRKKDAKEMIKTINESKVINKDQEMDEENLWNNLSKIIHKINYEKGDTINFEACNIVHNESLFSEETELEEYICSFK